MTDTSGPVHVIDFDSHEEHSDFTTWLVQRFSEPDAIESMASESHPVVWTEPPGQLGRGDTHRVFLNDPALEVVRASDAEMEIDDSISIDSIDELPDGCSLLVGQQGDHRG